jgi:hypothetical protein
MYYTGTASPCQCSKTAARLACLQHRLRRATIATGKRTDASPREGTTKDGSSIDLKDVSTVVTSQFASLAVVIEDIKPVAEVYTLNLTWEDIANNLKCKST